MLDKLYFDLQTYEPQVTDIQTTNDPSRGNLFSKITNVFKMNSASTKKEFIERPKSLYIYGGAGCGKVTLAAPRSIDPPTDEFPLESADGHLLRMYADQRKTTNPFQQFYVGISQP